LIIACLRPADHEFPGSDGDGRSGPVGRPVPGLAVEVRDENDKVLPNGGIGQVCVRGDGQMSGYLGDATATRQVMPDGWLRTGDLGRFDESGLLHLAGRLKDVIIRGGQKVSPLEVEAALEQHPQVGQAAVIGVPDPDWGEVPVAFVVPVPGEPMDPDDVLRFCVGRLAAYQRPVTLTVLSALPRGATGKLLRRELRDLADDRSRLAS
jgi:acyl-CoA synthetase (AMP-forming)/AMP-acid ligase II